MVEERAGLATCMAGYGIFRFNGIRKWGREVVALNY